MNLLSRPVSILFKAALSLTGLITCLNMASTPVLAQAIIEDPIADFSSGEPAVFAGAAVYLTPGAYLSTIAAEAVAPRGTYFAGFNGAYTVTAFSYIDPITHAAYPSITLHTGGLARLPYDIGGSIRGTVVERLRYGNLTLDEFTSLVRAAVGNDGLE